MEYTYQALGDGNFVGTYFSKNMVRPYQYVIKMTEKANPELGDTFDLKLTESNTGMTCSFSQWQLVEAMSKGSDRINVIASELIPQSLLTQEDFARCEEFAKVNVDFFVEELKRNGLETNAVFRLMEALVKIAFVELAKNIYEDMVVENYKRMQAEKK